MPMCKTPLEIRLYKALKAINKDFLTSDQLLKAGERLYGLSGTENLQAAYDNIQEFAKLATRGIRLPAVKKESVPTP